ncbi:hypothetical protein T8T21_17840 (plasmid) [Limimaricola variabilis]|jgi:hypothetical protein|nr:hypothetical protein [Limimaricola variabilis]WPY96607.1 hypothetical protein T8T21_17840 [Limimaricola variabilis]
MDLPSPAFEPTPREWFARIAEHLSEVRSGSPFQDTVEVVLCDETAR